MVLCDIGNSFYHFYKNNSKYHIDVNQTVDIKTDKIYFISVNDNATDRLKNRYNLVDLKDFIQFKSKYVGLGIDRVFASYLIKDGIVIDAGSAITVDLMENGEHLGGFILPGLKSYIETYKNISPKLNYELDKNIDLTKLPNSTSTAINFAIHTSIIESIKSFSQNKKFYFTGGDGFYLSKFFKNSIYDENLIFKSMQKVISENDL